MKTILCAVLASALCVAASGASVKERLLAEYRFDPPAAHEDGPLKLPPYAVSARSLASDRAILSLERHFAGSPSYDPVEYVQKVSIIAIESEPDTFFDNFRSYLSEFGEVGKKLRDEFEIDLPGDAVMRARIKSGLVIALDDDIHKKFILRPSRRKLVRYSYDFRMGSDLWSEGIVFPLLYLPKMAFRPIERLFN